MAPLRWQPPLMKAEATVDSVIQASAGAIVQLSGREMLDRIDRMLGLARQAASYEAFRQALYAQADRFFCRITCDSRETIPLTLALFWLAEGNLERSVMYAANVGRDADTIASMCGAIAGALGGVDDIRDDWVEKAQQVSSTDQTELAARLANVALLKHRREQEAHSLFERLI
jgi:ADP-ribosylglycohydrolase